MDCALLAGVTMVGVWLIVGAGDCAPSYLSIRHCGECRNPFLRPRYLFWARGMDTSFRWYDGGGVRGGGKV